MSRDLDKLTPRMQIVAHEIKRLLRTTFNTEIAIYCTLRTCEEQAIYYRKSRTRAQINAKMQSLTDRGFPELAAIIEEVGPQGEAGDLGKHVTHAGPGESFHQYGEALDAVPVVNGATVWDAPHLWEQYGTCAKLLGVTWGGDWGWDQPHIQMRPQKNPLNVLKPAEILPRLQELNAL